MKAATRSYNIAENEKYWFLSNILSITTGLASRNHSVGFEVLAGVVMKKFIFWDIAPCGPLKVNPRFGGICRLHHQGRGISPAGFKLSRAHCSETPSGSQLSTRRYIPEERNQNCVVVKIMLA
jgi:hypothetical protein